MNGFHQKVGIGFCVLHEHQQKLECRLHNQPELQWKRCNVIMLKWLKQTCLCQYHPELRTMLWNAITVLWIAYDMKLCIHHMILWFCYVMQCFYLMNCRTCCSPFSSSVIRCWLLVYQTFFLLFPLEWRVTFSHWILQWEYYYENHVNYSAAHLGGEKRVQPLDCR